MNYDDLKRMTEFFSRPIGPDPILKTETVKLKDLSKGVYVVSRTCGMNLVVYLSAKVIKHYKEMEPDKEVKVLL